MLQVKTKIQNNRTIILPLEYMKKLSMREGDEILLELNHDSINVKSFNDNIIKAQNIVRQFVPAGRNLTDELIAERLNEVENE